MAESDCVVNELEGTFVSLEKSVGFQSDMFLIACFLIPAGMMVAITPSQRCVCKASRSAKPNADVVYAADISDPGQFLICLKDQILINKCPLVSAIIR